MISFENAVRARGVPLAYRYPGHENWGYVAECFGEANYFVTLHDFVPGRHYGSLDAAKLRTLGATVAQMHTAVENFLPTALPSRSWSVSELPEQFFERQQKDHPNPDLESYLAEWDATGREARRFIVERVKGLAKYPVHQDLNGANLIYQDNQLQAIIDFDNSHDDYLFEDLVTPLLNHCAFASLKLTSQATHHFLDSYSQSHSFPDHELELCLYAWLAFQTWLGATTLSNKLEDASYTPNSLEILAKRTQARIQSIQQIIRKTT
jgi:Ser/Thr protein kinase RdoA (MazF antagonist)